jgi:hypothetical protein
LSFAANVGASLNKNDCWIGWIKEVPGVNCQERNLEELMESLKITLKEALEFDDDNSKDTGK